MKTIPVFAASLMLFLSLASYAQSQQTARLRGQILEVEHSRLLVKTEENEKISVGLRDNTPIALVQNASLADVKPGLFVGAAARPGADGRLVAQEVHIFPESLRGTGEGHTLIDRGNTMTNATVESVVSGVSGRTLKLNYRGGEKEIVVPDGIPIVQLSPADKSILKKGAHIFAPIAAQPDGTYVANRVFAGADGVVPPM